MSYTYHYTTKLCAQSSSAFQSSSFTLTLPSLQPGYYYNVSYNASITTQLCQGATCSSGFYLEVDMIIIAPNGLPVYANRFLATFVPGQSTTTTFSGSIGILSPGTYTIKLWLPYPTPQCSGTTCTVCATIDLNINVVTKSVFTSCPSGTQCMPISTCAQSLGTCVAFNCGSPIYQTCCCKPGPFSPSPTPTPSPSPIPEWVTYAAIAGAAAAAIGIGAALATRRG